MSFLTFEPETAGQPHQSPRSGEVFYLFDVWLGDDVVRAYPALMVTTPVKRALRGLDRPTGFRVTRARVRRSAFFRRVNPEKKLPVFWLLEVGSAPGRDDLGLTPAGVIVISRRILDVLQGFRIGRALMAQYDPASSP